ncbi:3-keto sterol reductase [Mycena amicta]|nr:3-keto sterol reductase [Mycena amicta]
MASFPVVVVTGANAGVGFGICQRLLFQLCTSNPPDSWPEPWATRANDLSLEPPTANGLTLIMACRSIKRAEAARDDLYHLLDAYIKKLRSDREYDGYADEFRHNLTIEVEHLDLANLETVFDFSARISARHSYVSHLIFNAGIACFSHINWLGAVRQLSTHFFEAITKPAFYIQSVGDLTVDGLGYTFQCNFFGHYVLFRTLEPLLHNTSYSPDSRVIWSSSLEASPKFYDKADWQHVRNHHSYESTKYQIDLTGAVLDLQALQNSTAPKRVRHFVSQPGIAHTKISANLVARGGILDTLKLILFYVARFFNTRHHSITGTNAAVAAVHLSLVALSFVTFSTMPRRKPSSNGSANGTANGDSRPSKFSPVRFGAESNRWGRAEVGLTPVVGWEENKLHAASLVEQSAALYDSIVRRRTST